MILEKFEVFQDAALSGWRLTSRQQHVSKPGGPEGMAADPLNPGCLSAHGPEASSLVSCPPWDSGWHTGYKGGAS